MQYYLRFYLSCMVVVSHFWTSIFVSPEGAYAVMGFYVISGYVITLVLAKVYHRMPGGTRKFLINRVLRLYPAYAVAALLGFAAISIYPETAYLINRAMILPESDLGMQAIVAEGLQPSSWPWFYFQQVIMLGQQSPFVWRSPILFAPNAWSINVEVYYYLLLAFGVTATLVRAKQFMSVGLVLIALYFLLIIGKDLGYFTLSGIFGIEKLDYFSLFYRSFFGFTFFFAIGALAFWLPKIEIKPGLRWAITIGVCIFPLLGVKGQYQYIIALLAFGFGIALLLRLWSDDVPTNGLGKLAGDISYPLFIIHWPVAVMVSGITGLEKNSLGFLLLAGSCSLVCAAIVVWFVEHPVERLRKRFRANPAGETQPV